MVNADQQFKADVLIVDGIITGVGQNLQVYFQTLARSLARSLTCSLAHADQQNYRIILWNLS